MGRRSDEGVVSTSFSIYFAPIFIYLLFPLSLRSFHMRFFSSPFVAYLHSHLTCLFSVLTGIGLMAAVYYKLYGTFVRSIFILTQISEYHVRAQQTPIALQRCRRWSFFCSFFSSFSGRQFILDVVASVFQLYLCVLLAFNQMNSVTRIAFVEMLMTCLCSEPGRVCWSP